MNSVDLVNSELEARPHVSRFRPRRNWLRLSVVLILAGVWIGIRVYQDAQVIDHNASTVDRLIEADYSVIDIPTPFEIVLAREDETGNREQARVRLLGIRQPWQWNHDLEQWRSDTRNAIAEWIGDSPIHVRLSRRQVSDDGVLLAHLQRDDVLLSDHLVRQGWMTVDANIDPSDGAIRALYRAEDEARLAARGIWSGRALGMIDYPGM